MQRLNPYTRSAKAVFSGKFLFFNAMTPNYHKSTSQVDLMRCKSLADVAITSQQVTMVAQVKFRWNIIALVIGLDENGDKTFQSSHAIATDHCCQDELKPQIDKLMSDAVHKRDNAVRVVKNTAWIVTPYKFNIKDEQIDELLTLKGAW